MKRAVEILKKIIFGHVGICILLLCILPFVFISHGLYRGIEIEQSPADSEMEDLIVVGFSQLGSESGWRTAHTRSIQEALTKDAGYFLIYNNARQTQENQIKTIRSFISQRVDYIVFAPVIESGWDTVLQEAKDAGIPVIVIDRMVDVKDESLYTTWIGTDAREEGKKAGIWLEQYLRERNRGRSVPRRRSAERRGLRRSRSAMRTGISWSLLRPILQRQRGRKSCGRCCTATRASMCWCPRTMI